MIGKDIVDEDRPDGHRPVPDPTVLTTAALIREIANLKELMLTRISASEVNITTINEHLQTRGASIRDEVERLRSLFDEKFNSVAVQLQERDKRLEQLTLSDKTAVAAALQAQKEAAAAQNLANTEAAFKTESSFTKQIDQMQMIINAIAKATDEKIDDLKTRLTLGEGRSKGFGEGWGIIVGAGGLATGVLIAASHYLVK